MRCFAAMVVCCAPALAAPTEAPKLPPELDHIVQLANACPPEFAADALLRVAAVTTIDKKLRMDLIDRAFHLAPGAQFRTPVTVVTRVPDTSAAMIAAAAKLNLDALSLQTRAVRLMLQLDKKTARQLFLDMNVPALESVTCDQTYIPDVSQLYQALTAVANSTFSDQERKKEEHINLVLGTMARATSSVQIAPMEQMVASLEVTAEQRDVLATRIAALRQSLSAPTCPQPRANDPASRADGFWKSDEGKRLLARGVQLRIKENGTLYTDAERDTPEWYEKLTDYMTDLANWKASDENDEASFYHQKAIVYEMLVELIPRGPERDKAIQAYVDFVASSNLQRERPAEWFFHAQSLLDRVRNTNTGEPLKIAAAFENSGNPVLVLYVELDRSKLPRL